ncbi:MAG: hypothetical protein ACYCSB_01240 [bacterium]|jgi:hypothetical protein
MGTVITLKKEEPAYIDVFYEISTKADYDRSRFDLYELGRIEKEIAESFEPEIKNAYAAHKSLVKEKTEAIAPIVEKETELKGKMLDFVLINPDVKDGVREDTKIKVVDIMSLVKAVLSGEVPPEAILPNEKFIAEKAKALGENLLWPGVDVYIEKVIVNRL